MELKNRYVIKGVYLPTNAVFWGGAKGHWHSDVSKAKVFSSSGAGNRVGSINRNSNWDAKKVPVAIKILED